MRMYKKMFFGLLMLLLLMACGGSSESGNTTPKAAETKETEKTVSMIDLTNVSVPEAEEKLNDLGLDSIEIKKGDPEWPDNRYVVTEQSVAPGWKSNQEKKSL